MRSGFSLRMHRRIAVEAVIGFVAAQMRRGRQHRRDRIAANRMTSKPITAFQNPITDQGRVTAEQRDQHDIDDAEAAGRERRAP